MYYNNHLYTNKEIILIIREFHNKRQQKLERQLIKECFIKLKQEKQETKINNI